MSIDWHRAPLVRLTIPFLLGAAMAWGFAESIIALSLPWVFVSGATISLILLVIFVFRKKWKYPRYAPIFGFLISIGFTCFGFCITAQTIFDAETDGVQLPYCDTYEATVESPAMRKTKTVAFRLNLCNCRIGESQTSVHRIGVLAYIPPDSLTALIETGDTLLFSGRLQEPDPALNPGSFDYGAYLKKQGISATIYLGNGYSRTSGSERENPKYWFKSIQQGAIAIFRDLGISGDELGVASALILGERNLLESQVRDAFSEAGVVHILAVSGLHVGLLFVVISWIIQRVLPQDRRALIRALLAISFLWIYAGITGFSPSVLRAATMFSFIAIGRTRGSSTSIYNMMAASAMILVIIEPNLLVEVGFQLSYLAVLGILVLHKPIYSLCSFRPWLLDKAWSLLVVSFTAQLATFPLTTYYFGQFPTYFLLANLVVIPVATGILYVGLTLLLLHWIPFLSAALAWVFAVLLKTLLFFVAQTTVLPGSRITDLYLDKTMVILLYVLIIALIAAFAWPRKRYLRLAEISFLVVVIITCSRSVMRHQRMETWLLATPKGAVPIMLDGSHAFVALRDSVFLTDVGVNRSISGFFRVNQVRSVAYQSLHTRQPNGWLRTEEIIYSRKSVVVLDQNAAMLPEYQNRAQIFALVGNETNSFEELDVTLVLEPNLKYYKRLKWDAVIESSELTAWDMSAQGAIRLD